MQRIACSLLFALVATRDAPAETPVRKVRWPEVAALVERDPRLGDASQRVAAAAAEVRAAGQLPNPTLEASAARGAARAGDESRAEWGLALAVPLDWLGRRGARVDAAAASLDVARQDRLAVRLAALEQLRLLFWTAAYDRLREESLSETFEQEARLGELVRLRVAGGEARPIETVRIEVELEKLRNELEAAETLAATRRRQLGIWLGAGELDADADLATDDDLPALAGYLDRVRAGHPQLAAARARVREAGTRVSVERSQRLPSLGLRAFAASELDRYSAGGGVSVELPLWNRNAGGIARAEAETGAAGARVEAATRELLAEAVDAHGQCDRARRTAARFRDAILPRTERTVDTLERSFQVGESSLLDVVDARRVLADARRDQLAALLDARLSCSRMLAFTGELR